MANYKIQAILDRAERVRDNYAATAQRVNSDPKNNFQARRDDLAAVRL